MRDALWLYSNSAGLGHNTGDAHPENTRRLMTLRAMFESDYPELTHIDRVDALLPLDWLKTVHAPELIDTLSTTKTAQIDGDTILSPGSWLAALEAASIAAQASRDVINGRTNAAFCALRPPGHHAEYARAMGFCLLNNAVIAALKALENEECDKVAIIDWDAHHGNGTEDLVRRRKTDDIHYLSTHEWPLFPGTGGPDAPDHPMITNRVLSSCSGSESFRAVFEKEILPVIEHHAPDILVISAGFDAHRDDPLATLTWDEEDYAWATQMLKVLGKPMIFVLEGGYDLFALENSVTAVIDTLIT